MVNRHGAIGLTVPLGCGTAPGRGGIGPSRPTGVPLGNGMDIYRNKKELVSVSHRIGVFPAGPRLAPLPRFRNRTNRARFNLLTTCTTSRPCPIDWDDHHNRALETTK